MIGIGISVSSAGIILGATITALFLRRKKRRAQQTKREKSSDVGELHGHDMPAEMEITRWEMIDQDYGAELDDNERRELDGMMRVELSA